MQQWSHDPYPSLLQISLFFFLSIFGHYFLDNLSNHFFHCLNNGTFFFPVLLIWYIHNIIKLVSLKLIKLVGIQIKTCLILVLSGTWMLQSLNPADKIKNHVETNLWFCCSQLNLLLYLLTCHHGNH